MGVLGVQGWTMVQRQSLCVAAVALLVFSPLNIEAQPPSFLPAQVDALQALWTAWNESTPNVDSNLQGWSSDQTYPCWQNIADSNVFTPDWRGVQCMRINDSDPVAYIVGLTLNNASIAGVLPPEIGNISTLSVLQLTGNPNLTGPLPQEFRNPYLSILDLHDNGFTGALPTFWSNAFLNVDMSGNGFVGGYPDQINYWYYVQTLSLARNRFSGIIPSGTFDLNTQLESLDLSENMFTGALPNFTTCTRLKSVFLDNNSFSGILDITQLIAIGLVWSNGSRGPTSLSMMNNNITTVIYRVGSLRDITTAVRLQGNPYCSNGGHDEGTRCFCEQLCSNQGPLSNISSNNNKKVVIIAAVTSSTLALVVIIVVVATVLYRAQRYKRYLLLELQQKLEEYDVKPTIYAYNEVRAATIDFHPDMKLGEGGYGAVYKGVLPNRSVVAVKQLYDKNTRSVDDFLNEVVLITGMKHRNLVNLKGCCLRGRQRLLIYEYVDNYDIDQILLRGEKKTSLSWAVRQKICLGVAHGLEYLHSHALPRIIHRDIKASNILLDKDFNPKIADFGLALLFPDEQSHIMTIHVAGTKGYLAPEYAALGMMSDKVDVYSFGVLCLEVLSGRRNLDETLPRDQVYLCNWARTLHDVGKMTDLVDPSLVLHGDESIEVQRLINIALMCTKNGAEQRPTMARVVAMLQNDRESDVEVRTSEKNEQELHTLQLLAFGKEIELSAVTESEDGETTALNPRSSFKQRTLRSDDNLDLV